MISDQTDLGVEPRRAMIDQTKLLSRVRSRLERGERIDTADCAALFEVHDLGALGRLARIGRERRFGRDAFYYAGAVLDYDITTTTEEFVSTMEEAIALDPTAGATVRLRSLGTVGEDESHDGLLDLWCERLATISRRGAGVVFRITPRVIDDLAVDAKMSHAEVIARLVAVAPCIISGDEAELFEDRFRRIEAPTAIASERWIAVHRAAHVAGVRTIAAMSYGTVDHADAYAEHLDRIRRMQDEHAGFIAFLPMAIHNSDAEEFYLSAPTAVQTLRATTIARIALDNISHILVAPSLVTLEVATVALSYGADMLDRTVAIGDVLATEPNVARRPQSLDPLAVINSDALPIISSDTRTLSRYETSDRIRANILEARWQAVAVDITHPLPPLGEGV